MSRTVILAFASKKDAQVQAANYASDHKVMILGPTDQVLLARESEDGLVWRSGPDSDFYVMVATKDVIAGAA